jgi:hypothetical protein
MNDFERGRSGQGPNPLGDPHEYARGQAAAAGRERFDRSLEGVHKAGANVGFNLTHHPQRWLKGIVLSSAAFAVIGAVVSALPLQRSTPLQDGLIVGIASFAFELAFAALVLATLAAKVVLPSAVLFGALGAGAGWLISSSSHDPAARINQMAIQSGIVGAGVGCLVGLLVALRRRTRKR